MQQSSSESEAKDEPPSTISQLIKFLDGFVKKLPSVDDPLFWMLTSVVILFYVGASELILAYGPGPVLSALAIVLAGIYFVLARQHFRKPETWVLELDLLIGFVVVIVDAIITGIRTPLSVLIVVSQIMLLLSCYKSLKRIV
jgi:hypothetical protein